MSNFFILYPTHWALYWKKTKKKKNSDDTKTTEALQLNKEKAGIQFFLHVHPQNYGRISFRKVLCFKMYTSFPSNC